MLKRNHSTLHTLYNIKQSATQGSNGTTQSRRTAATTRFSRETDGAKVLSTMRSGKPLPCKHSPDGATKAR